MNKSIIGTFNVPTPDDLVKARIEQEKKEAAREKAKNARKAAAARKKAEHKNYVIRYIVFIGLCLLDVVFLIKGYIYVCNNWFDLYFTQTSDGDGLIFGILIGIFYFGIAGPCAGGIGYGLFKMFKLEK